MRVIQVKLSNFRNYSHAEMALTEGRNIIIGENAQGKTNFLEAIELLSLGKSSRSQHDSDLILKGENQCRVDIAFMARSVEENVALTMTVNSGKLEKQAKVNGLTVSGRSSSWRGRLVTVRFASSDLNLLRGGPKYRRDWIDTLTAILRPVYADNLSKFQKIITQRNRLLKTLFEKGRVGVSDQDQLKVWDQQVASYGAAILCQRWRNLEETLPISQTYQHSISGARETLSIQYKFSQKDDDDQPEGTPESQASAMPDKLSELVKIEESEVASTIMRLLKQRRYEEIARKQTLTGPHRDDLTFCLNGASAEDFGSQGQQRSVVLALKLAELDLVSKFLREPPVLLLDDVLAELDLNRQGALMASLPANLQTLITTTHLDGFRPEWLENANFLSVAGGTIKRVAEMSFSK